MRLVVETRGISRLVQLKERLRQFTTRGLIRRLGDIAKKDHERRVLSEKTSPDGGAWAPLKPSTIRKKGSSEIMVETGKLAKSFVNSVSGDIARIWNSARSERGAAYIRFHDTGTRRMVQRRITGLSDANLREIRIATEAFVHERLGFF